MVLKNIYITLFFIVVTAFFQGQVQGQSRGFQNAGSRLGRGGGFGGGAGGGKGDSLEHRTGLEDSITIRFRYIDSSRLQQFDSTIKDFNRKFPIPWYHVGLGNFGNATQSNLFSPMMHAGWDHGFHAYDVYNFSVASTRFYNTNRPYSEIGYFIGSIAEQMINLLHTQNIKPNWNLAFQYRLINSPGTFQNQNTNHSNYRLTSWYQTKNKRYQNFFVLVGNKLASGENGGIKNDGNYLDSGVYITSRFNIPTQIGPVQQQSRNLFSTNIATGTNYTNASYLFRQQYDLGQKDSIVVNDTTVVPLFYPRVRFEHTVSYNTYNYRFNDNSGDSAYYKKNYGIAFPSLPGAIFRRDLWNELFNDFSIYQFPDSKNSQQFIKVGASFQILKADFDTGIVKKSYTNLWLHGEYRNKTRNRKWDIEAYGGFYLGGYNAGDYDAHISLQRLISPKLGYLQVGFENVNRRPSFIYDTLSSFYLDQPVKLNKENTIHFFGAIERPRQGLKISADYYLLSNYTYIKDYYKVGQVSSIFNVLRISAEKDFKLGRKGMHWRTWLVFQQKAGNADLNLPLIFTRNQLAYDGNLGFKNLLISMGIELKYFTPYKANNYSPVQGQFFYQDKERIAMRAPEFSAFLNFRIKAFTTYARIDNLNSISIQNGGFTGNNILISNYPSPGMQIRLGIFWSFVN